MFDSTKEIALLEATLNSVGLKSEDFQLSKPYWKIKKYKKGDFYNEYKNICKHLGFIVDGVFRIYKVDSETGEEKNMLFFSDRQFIASYKSFLRQTACEYYTEAMKDSVILYIHIDHLNELYNKSHKWERFGRIVAETAFHEVMANTESFLFKTVEDRYKEMVEKHPNIFNSIPLYHIASYLGIQGPSLSRIRKRMVSK